MAFGEAEFMWYRQSGEATFDKESKSAFQQRKTKSLLKSNFKRYLHSLQIRVGHRTDTFCENANYFFPV